MKGVNNIGKNHTLVLDYRKIPEGDSRDAPS